MPYPMIPLRVSYLDAFQHPDGSFSNVNVGHAVCRSLADADHRVERVEQPLRNVETVPGPDFRHVSATVADRERKKPNWTMKEMM